MTLSLLITICLPHIHSLFFSTAQDRISWVCWEDPNSSLGWILAALVEFLVGYVVVIVVFVLNMILIVLIARNRMPRTSADGPTSAHRRCCNKRLTRTLLGVAVVFLVCETPRMITSVVCRFIARTPFLRIVLNASFVLSGLNHATNFFIYIVSSPRFRQLLVESLRRGPLRLRRRRMEEPARQQQHQQRRVARDETAEERVAAENPRDIYVQINLKVIVSSVNEASH